MNLTLRLTGNLQQLGVFVIHQALDTRQQGATTSNPLSCFRQHAVIRVALQSDELSQRRTAWIVKTAIDHCFGIQLQHLEVFHDDLLVVAMTTHVTIKQNAFWVNQGLARLFVSRFPVFNKDVALCWSVARTRRPVREQRARTYPLRHHRVALEGVETLPREQVEEVTAGQLSHVEVSQTLTHSFDGW